MNGLENCRRPKGVLFNQDNAPAYKFVVVMADVRDCGFELADHPPYYPDLAPPDYFLFTNMKSSGLMDTSKLRTSVRPRDLSAKVPGRTLYYLFLSSSSSFL